MVGCKVKGYTRSCATNVGGADMLLVGDANDFNLTEVLDDNGDVIGYSAIERRIGAGAEGTATVVAGELTEIEITDGGSGYALAPTVVIEGDGSGAEAVATISNGVVTGITITAPGADYTEPPTITFTGGGATAEGGAMLFPIDYLEDSIGVEMNQANAEGSSSSWEYIIAARLAKFCQAMTNFNTKIDRASACCQMIFFWRTNDGTIFVAGEKYVNDLLIPKFRLRQDGSKIGIGKKFSDFNGQDLSIKGSYSRPANEFTGGIGALQEFIAL